MCPKTVALNLLDQGMKKTIDEILREHNSELFNRLSRYSYPLPKGLQGAPCAVFSNGKESYICMATPFADSKDNYGIRKSDFERCATEFLKRVEPA
jgi:hypothetical protein